MEIFITNKQSNVFSIFRDCEKGCPNTKSILKGVCFIFQSFCQDNLLVIINFYKIKYLKYIQENVVKGSSTKAKKIFPFKC